MDVPQQRIRNINSKDLNPDGHYILYWMIACRRTRWNFALQRAVEVARELERPLVILEPLNCNYPYASDRLHRFILQGMAENLKAMQGQPATYYPYIEPQPDAGKGLLAAMSAQACLVVTDDFPAFFFPKLLDSAGSHLPMRLEAVDGNGLLPMRVTEQAYPTAYAFRRFLQKTLPQHLMEWPAPNPCDRISASGAVDFPKSLRERWPSSMSDLQKETITLDDLPIDHSVAPGQRTGGAEAAHEHLNHFLQNNLAHYAAESNHPDADVTSGLSPYLHFGHISSHEVFAAVVDQEDWDPHQLSEQTAGKRRGWWRMSENAEAFLDQLITWRELGFNMCCHEPDRYRDPDNLPDWAKKTLQEHRQDSRPHCYTLEEFTRGETHDPLWNAAQKQLREDGILHNYLRMLWGKKILQWSRSPEEALEIMIELNDRYALDGRDPNSYSGIFWCLGRYDHAWGPERPVFGKVRYMSSTNTRKKLKLKHYLETYGEG
ncbi:MAG: FAD-binding domain-containing protein [Desulfuromonadales bacterium]